MKRPHFIKYVPEYIESMKELIKRYEKALELGISKSEYERLYNLNCLLCFPIGIDHRYLLDCKKDRCPWIVITGRSCTAQEITPFSSTNKDVILARIEELKRWIAIYEEYQFKGEQ